MIMVASGVTSGTEREDGIVKGYKEFSIIPVMLYFLKKQIWSKYGKCQHSLNLGSRHMLPTYVGAYYILLKIFLHF